METVAAILLGVTPRTAVANLAFTVIEMFPSETRRFVFDLVKLKSNTGIENETIAALIGHKEHLVPDNSHQSSNHHHYRWLI
jgi:hypothetical protein